MRIGVLISGRGSNMERIVEATQDGRLPSVEVACVVSDNPKAAGLERAKQLGVRAHCLAAGPKTTLKSPYEEVYVDLLRSYSVDLVCLAGFMRLLKTPFIEAFRGSVINIHPSLLPKHRGLNAQQKALDAGDAESGCTVHWVDAGIDTGRIIDRRVVPILDGDTVASLSARILEQEHQLYIDVLARLSADGGG